jgi:hypothetical protein
MPLCFRFVNLKLEVDKKSEVLVDLLFCEIQFLVLMIFVVQIDEFISRSLHRRQLRKRRAVSDFFASHPAIGQRLKKLFHCRQAEGQHASTSSSIDYLK